MDPIPPKKRTLRSIDAQLTRAGVPPGAANGAARQPAESPVDGEAGEWSARLRYQKQQSGPDTIKPVLANIITILKHHPEWTSRIHFDEHAYREIATDPPWHTDEAAGGNAQGAQEWSDSDTGRLQAWLLRTVDVDFKIADCDRAVSIVARASPRHPFREYLDSLTWDRVPRLDTWLASYLGVPITEYSKRVGAWWVIAACARTYTPGCKVDNVLILEGAQGMKKSTALRTLAGEKWFSDTPFVIGSKDAYLSIQGRVIVELAELDSLKRAESSAAKVFFSSPVDDYRPPYGKRMVRVLRACVFAGSVNENEYLRDPTGGRRYWPVQCSEIDLPGLAAARDLLWSEAVFRFKSGARWWPEGPEETALCVEQQETRTEGDAWADMIGAFVLDRGEVTVAVVLKDCCKVEVCDFNQRDQNRVAHALVGLGYQRVRVRDGRSLKWVYRRDD